MRPPRRFPLSRCGIIFSLIAGFPGASFPQSSNPQGQQTQSAQVASATQAQLPPKWNDAVHTLAEKIAAVAAPSRKLSLEMKNMSSLENNDLGAIQRELERALREHQLRLVAVSSSDTQARVTLSEGTAGRVLVGEIQWGLDRQVTIEPAPTEPVDSADNQPEALTLAAKLVWEQSERFLDFALYEGKPGFESTLLIVEPGRLVYYRSTNPQLQLLRTIHIPHPKQARRDIEALIAIREDRILLTDAECSGNLLVPDEVHCREFPRIFGLNTASNIPGHEGSLTTTLSQKCSGGLVMLTSGTGDWTQPDTLQAFERMQSQKPPIQAGNVINFDGPIMSLTPNGEGVVARLVVQNLKTGNYEAYLVTAICSH